MTKKLVHIGMDDIDSPRGGCTTHFASLLVEQLSGWGVDWIDYPNLVRLNPNIPYRTRGNGAVSLRFRVKEDRISDLLPFIDRMIQEYIDLKYPNTNPGVVVLEGEIQESVRQFAMRALWKTIPLEIARRVIRESGIDSIAHGNGRGLVGAVSAIGNNLMNDFTYEYIAYRALNKTNEQREVDNDSVVEMDRIMGDKLFSSIDDQSGRNVIAPHGPDPVLFGIRGERPDYVIEAASLVRSEQSVSRWMVFRTNQGTGAHLMNCVYISDLRPYMAAVVHGVIESKSRILEGGHVIFGVGDCSGRIDCAAYEPTGNFRETITGLEKGDQVMIHGGVRPASRLHGLTLNAEGIEVLKLAAAPKMLNPLCPVCEKRMKSAGRDKGYKCANCGFKDPKAKKIATPASREIEEKVYLPPIRAQRHLTRPEVRFGRRNNEVPVTLVKKWSSHLQVRKCRE